VSAGLPIHPAADLFPMLPASELQALADDIRTNGQREPVVLWDGQVLDGRNRLAACALAGVEPLTRTLDVCPDPLAYVLSTNLHRRHLSESQRAMVAAKVRPMLAEQAKARQTAAGAHGAEGGRGNTKDGGETLSPNLGEGFGKSADQAATMLSVGRGTVEAASRVLKRGTPELISAVERGDVAVSAAAAVASLPAEDQREAVAGGAGAIREKAKAIREAKPKAPPPAPARHPVLDEIDGAADLGALDRAFNRVALAGLSEADSEAAATAYQRRGAELRAQHQAPAEVPAAVPSQPTSAATVTVDAAEWEALCQWRDSVTARAGVGDEASVGKAMRLVALANSPNEHEAASAAVKACRTIRERGLLIATSAQPSSVGTAGLDEWFENMRKQTRAFWSDLGRELLNVERPGVPS
jgi:ParB-like chromosome segregation protein Spo0J